MSFLLWVLILLGGLLALVGLAFVAMLVWLQMTVNDEDEINRS